MKTTLDCIPCLLRQATDAIRLCSPDPAAEVIDNGSATPGTSLPECSPEFRRHFAAADLVIAKGQGNFETLQEVPAPLFCLFRVKCPRVADHCGHPIGSHLVWQATK